jgi:hypothetical protein
MNEFIGTGTCSTDHTNHSSMLLLIIFFGRGYFYFIRFCINSTQPTPHNTVEPELTHVPVPFGQACEDWRNGCDSCWEMEIRCSDLDVPSLPLSTPTHLKRTYYATCKGPGLRWKPNGGLQSSSIVNCIACYNDEKLHTLNMKPSHDRMTSLSCWHPAQMTMEQPASSNIHRMLLPWLRDWFHGVDAKDDVKAFVIHAAKSCGIDLPTCSSKDGRSSCVMPLHHEHI